MNNVKLKMLKQNIDSVETVMSTLESVITPRYYEAIMDSADAREGVAFFNFELGPEKLRRIYSHYTYLFVDFMKEAGKISRHYRMMETSGQRVRISPIGSLLATLAMKDIDDLSYGEFVTTRDVTRLTNVILKGFDVDVITPELKTAIRREVRQHVTSSTVDGRYYSRRSKLILHVMTSGTKSLYSVK